MTALEPGDVDTAWLTVPDLMDSLDVSQSRIRTLLNDQYLLGSRRDGALRVPEVFLQDGAPIPSLRGTVTVLTDVGLTDDEAIDWLLAHDDEIGAAPITALRAGHKSDVRRVAKTLM